MKRRNHNTRREFLTEVALAGAGIAAAGVLSRPEGVEAATTSESETWNKETDVVVAGAGLGGLCAALTAVQGKVTDWGADDERVTELGGIPGEVAHPVVEAGVETILLEASNETGGSSLFSDGLIHAWGAETFAKLQQRVPLIDPVLGRVYVETYANALAWLKGTGAFRQEAPEALTSLLGENILFLGTTYAEKRQTFDYLDWLFAEVGGELITGTKAIKLFANATGRVIGVRAINRDGTLLNIKARKAVVLATGGFAANRELSVRYLGPSADNAIICSVPGSQGDALLMATEAGALLSRGFATFYGHLQAYPPVVPQTEADYEVFDKQLLRDLMAAIQVYTPNSIVVNVLGERFVDESLGDEIINQAIVVQPEGRVFVLLDAETVKPLDNIELLQEHGAVVETADTLAKLAEKLSIHRVDTVHLMATIEAFTAAMDAGTTPALTPPKGRNAFKLATPPFYAIQATSGISAPYGGILINDKAQALGRGGVPIPGLYAVPHAAGGIFYKHDGGSLGLCAVFGRIGGFYAAKEKSLS